MWQKILVAIDRSDIAKKALATAVELARLSGARLTIMMVGQLPEFAATVGEVTEAKAEVQKRLWPILLEAQTQAKEQGVVASGELHFGHPAETIVDFLRKHPQDVVVVGYKGASGIQSFLLGSVSSKVVHHAPCSVLVVK